uniref:Si:ch211-244c8.4 n=1 Tax=Astyanax mexicanus TaxID=7994 RepID=A0A3B1K9S4_ASTMX
MDTQSESCEPPPCDPQPPGKIRKALKLFSKRKPGSSMASIFSMRSKSEGGPKSPPSRSKTLDGLTESVEESQKEDAPMEEPESKDGNGNGNLETTPTRQSISSITSAKSLSFLNMLRRSRKGGGGERYAQTESQRPGRQRKGLKGLFGSVRWPGKDKEEVDEVEPGPPLLASRSNSVEIIKENLTLTPRPAPRSPDDSEIEQQPPASQDEPVSSEDTKLKPTLSPTPTLSSTSSSKPSPTTTAQPFSSSTTSPKPMPKHATSARPTHKPEPESPPLQATFSTGPRGEKTGVHTRPQQPQPAAQDQLPVAAYKSEQKSPAVKSAALSKIPVSGGGRPKQLHKDGQSNGDEGHWNLPTPVHEEESPVTLSRESSSKEPLSDFSTGSGAVTPTLSHSHEDILDSRPIIGATSLPRESKIPMKPGSTATYHSLQGKTEAARSKIPVSKMPVRRTSNKPPSTRKAGKDGSREWEKKGRQKWEKRGW